jgi:hypothetical protein
MRFFNQAQRLLTLVVLCVAFAIVASAQFESATILDTVTDPSTASIFGLHKNLPITGRRYPQFRAADSGRFEASVLVASDRCHIPSMTVGVR